jgi:hypothetical protein
LTTGGKERKNKSGNGKGVVFHDAPIDAKNSSYVRLIS